MLSIRICFDLLALLALGVGRMTAHLELTQLHSQSLGFRFLAEEKARESSS
jgi:hypothetical protein